MIELYSGTPGSGKSLHVAECIYWRLRRKRLVVGNFEINRKAVSKDDVPFICLENREMTPKRLIEISERYRYIGTNEDGSKNYKRVEEDSILLVIDECQLMFNSREWQKGGRDEWLTFFSQHRKFGYKIILIAQFDGMIDKQIRSLIEYEYKHRKVSNFGFVGKIISLFYLGSAFCAVQMWYPLNERLSSEIFRYRRKYADLYDTYKMFEKI